MASSPPKSSSAAECWVTWIKAERFVVKQQDVGSGHWEMTLMDVRMNGKALFFKNIDVAEKDTYANFQPVTEGITFQKAAELWRIIRLTPPMPAHPEIS